MELKKPAKDSWLKVGLETKAPALKLLKAPMGKQARGRGRARAAPKRRPKTLPSLPPSIDVAAACHNVFRFQNTNATNRGITVSGLLGICGAVVTVTNMTAVGVATSVRLHKVRVWPAAAGFCNLVWGAIAGTDKDTTKDVTVPTGITQTGCLEFRPPKNTILADWLETTSAVIFYLACTVGSVVDVDISFTLPGGSTPPSYAITAAGIGSFGYMALDGPVINTYKPVGLVTIS